MVERKLKLALKIRAAVYARYSSEMQSSTSADDQVKRIQRLAGEGSIESRLHPGAYVDVLESWIQKDEALSGKVAGRRGYQIILQGIRNREFNILLVDDLSRLTRSLGNLLELYQLLKHFDVELISISDRVSSADPNAKTFFTVKGMVADFGNEAHSERTKRGLEARARDLFSTGQKPYGYDSVATRIERRKNRDVPSHYKIIINPEKADVVRKIFTMYSQGYGQIHIAKQLNQNKVPSPKNAMEWKISPIHRMLKNEKYIGRWVYNQNTTSFDPDSGRRVQKQLPRSQWVISENEDLRIVPHDIWEIVQKRLTENLKARNENERNSHKGSFGPGKRRDNLHLLSGALRCEECSGNIVIVSGRRQGYYGCINAHRHGNCKSKALINRSKIESEVITCLEESLISNKDVIQYATSQYNSMMRTYMNSAPDRHRNAEKELVKVSVELKNLLKFIMDGNCIDSSSITETIREKESQKAKLESEIRHLDKAEDRKLLVTPYLVQSRLAQTLKTISDKGEYYNSLMKGLFRGTLLLKTEEKSILMKAQVNLGYALGSTQYAFVSATAYQLNIEESPITIEIFKVISKGGK